MQQNLAKIDSLTGLRFYLASLVVVCHTLKIFYGQDNCYGIIGVSMFFLLSGFILYYNYFSNRDTQPDIPRFYIARFARIYPVFFVTMLLAIPYQHLVLKSDFWMNFIKQIFLIQSWWTDSKWTFNGVAWTISVEAFFYVVFPFLGFWIFRSKHPVKMFLLGLGILLAYNGFINEYFCCIHYTADLCFPPNRLIEFLCGMFVGWFYVEHPGFLSHLNITRFLKMELLTTLLVLFWVIIQLSNLGINNVYFGHQYNLYYLLPGCLIIYLLAWSERQGIFWKWVAGPWAVLGGEVSYALYLLHQLVLLGLAGIFGKLYHFPLVDWATNGELSRIATVLPTERFIFGIIGDYLSLLGAYCLYRWIERPMRKRILGGFDKLYSPKNNVVLLETERKLNSAQRRQG